MGNMLGEMPASAGRSVRMHALALWSLGLIVAACGGDDTPRADPPISTTTASSEPAAAAPALLPCAEDRHMVAVDILGLLTVENVEVLGPWIDGATEPTPRSGAPEVFRAYRERGYELLYITTIPPNAFRDRSVEETATEWLTDNGFPSGPGTQIWVWDGVSRPDGQTWISITDEMLALAAEGVAIDAAYSENYDKTYAFAAGGVSPERNFSITPVESPGEAGPTSAPTSWIPNDDLVAHAAAVQQLPPVCQVG